MTMPSHGSYSDDVLLLIRLGDEAGGRVDPERIARRRPESFARRAFDEAQRAGLLDAAGWLTRTGQRALKEWE